jgi:tRNA threonylcarbamoyladenosine modification (KEOPS) complex  Pcc1 subunit
MRAKAVTRLRFPTERHLETVFRALEPEVMKAATVRSKAKLRKDDRFLILKIEAKDTVALRAALNAYLRWINAVLSVIEILKTH